MGVRKQGLEVDFENIGRQKRYQKKAHNSFETCTMEVAACCKKNGSTSVMQNGTFFPAELCETGSVFAVHTSCCRSEDEYLEVQTCFK